MIKTILCLSDTHGKHRQLQELPDADVVIHCGDFTDLGTETEALDFLEWFCDLPHRHKIFTPGNHDTCLFGAGVEGLDDNVHFLYNSGVEIEGLNFYGVPFFIEGLGNDYARRIPEGTDVLISHQPPYGILDKAYESGYGDVRFGSESLLTRVSEITPMLCIFGHIHPMYGKAVQNGTTFVNAALMKEDSALNAPILLDLTDSNTQSYTYTKSSRRTVYDRMEKFSSPPMESQQQD